MRAQQEGQDVKFSRAGLSKSGNHKANNFGQGGVACRVTILQVPSIQKGGSRQVDLELLQAQVTNNQQVGAIGIEALISLRRVIFYYSLH